MGDERLDAIVRRVEVLEAEVRRWRRAATALVLAGAAMATIGATIPRGRIVEARKFVLSDAAGRVRAELGPSDNEKSIALRFKDEAGSPRLTLGVEDESSLLVLSDKTGRPRPRRAGSRARRRAPHDPAGRPWRHRGAGAQAHRPSWHAGRGA